jgi:hypothetical protein
MPDTEKIDDSFAPLRKGLLEFAVLSVVSRHKVYAADILDRPFRSGAKLSSIFSVSGMFKATFP